MPRPGRLAPTERLGTRPDIERMPPSGEPNATPRAGGRVHRNRTGPDRRARRVSGHHPPERGAGADGTAAARPTAERHRTARVRPVLRADGPRPVRRGARGRRRRSDHRPDARPPPGVRRRPRRHPGHQRSWHTGRRTVRRARADVRRGRRRAPWPRPGPTSSRPPSPRTPSCCASWRASTAPRWSPRSSSSRPAAARCWPTSPAPRDLDALFADDAEPLAVSRPTGG